MAGGLLSFFSNPTQLPTLSAGDALNATANQIGNLPGLNALTTQANNDTNQQFQQSINSVAPGILPGLATSSQNASSLLSGQIPADVQAALQRSTAFQALSGGFGASSGMGQGLTARDLGLTSLNLMQQGQSMLNQDTSLAGMLTPGRMSPGSLLFNQQQMLGIQGQNNQVNYANSQMQSGFNQFLGNIIPSMFNQGAQFGGAAASQGGQLGLKNLFGGGGNSGPNSASGGAGFSAQYTPQYNPYSSSFANPFSSSSSSAPGGGFSLSSLMPLAATAL